jgi:hypothetical protein
VLLIIVSIFSFAVYNSKSEFYRKHNEFYNQIFTAQVTKIVEGRGTKIFYNSNNYFYSDYCEEEYKLEKLIKVGDVIRKKTGILEIYREDFQIISCKVIKP